MEAVGTSRRAQEALVEVLYFKIPRETQLLVVQEHQIRGTQVGLVATLEAARTTLALVVAVVLGLPETLAALILLRQQAWEEMAAQVFRRPFLDLLLRALVVAVDVVKTRQARELALTAGAMVEIQPRQQGRLALPIRAAAAGEGWTIAP